MTTTDRPFSHTIRQQSLGGYWFKIVKNLRSYPRTFIGYEGLWETNELLINPKMTSKYNLVNIYTNFTCKELSGLMIIELEDGTWTCVTQLNDDAMRSLYSRSHSLSLHQLVQLEGEI